MVLSWPHYDALAVNALAALAQSRSMLDVFSRKPHTHTHTHTHSHTVTHSHTPHQHHTIIDQTPFDSVVHSSFNPRRLRHEWKLDFTSGLPDVAGLSRDELLTGYVFAFVVRFMKSARLSVMVWCASDLVSNVSIIIV